MRPGLVPVDGGRDPRGELPHEGIAFPLGAAEHCGVAGADTCTPHPYVCAAGIAFAAGKETLCPEYYKNSEAN